jgi:hypothetical protein
VASATPAVTPVVVAGVSSTATACSSVLIFKILPSWLALVEGNLPFDPFDPLAF